MRAGPWRLERLHVRKEHLLVWITQGQGSAFLHGVNRGYVMHTALFVPTDCVFSIEIQRQVLAQTIRVPRNAAVNFPKRPQLLRVRDQTSQVELGTIIDALQTESRAPRPHYDEAVAAHTALLSVWVRRQLQERHNHRLGETRSEKLVMAFCDLVAQNFRSGRPVADYAADLDITPTHLARVCRQITGRTAAEILTACVLHEARITLGDSTAPINAVARDLGFGSAAYFTRFIQQHTGQTPTKLRLSGGGSRF